ncbi:uncharacterized protein LOC117177896 [Belonocnema kinseyi]|uniref:uncharacterized protein LOC117177896 n=1 Tax=Belonocnema kinseyi TaxID=2817044 RepID=UPI00143CFD01|nr:uncharacterized protein LOC117177896 [Belonocnema kinseyi]
MSPKRKVGGPNVAFTHQNQSKQSPEKAKAILRDHIQTLKSLKSVIKQKLNTCTNNLENTRRFSQTDDLSESEVKKLPIGSFSVKNELFNFAGIQCIKSFKDEYIFHFFAKGEGNKSCVYSVQFFNVDNKGEIGKYVMPKFMDIELILKETPLDNITYAVQFIRNCKHYIDCYHNRMDQFITLKKSLQKVTNCNLFNIKLSYEYVNIELLGVYDKESGAHISIILYLVYNLKETRPYLIKIDTLRGTPLNKETEKDLKSYLKAFKKLSLIEALESIEKEEDPLFSWKRAGENQIDIYLQESDESSSEEFVPIRKRIRIRKKNRRVEKKNPLVKTDVIKKRKGRINLRPSEADISKFLTKYKNVSQSKDPKESKKEESKKDEPENEESQIENFSDVSTVKLSQVDSTPVKNIEIVEKIKKKRTEQSNHVMEKISEHETSGEGRVLRSKTNSPTKAAPPNEATPKKVDSQKKALTTSKKSPVKKPSPRPKRLVTPKRIEPSKKVASLKKTAFPKITISPNIYKAKLRQTSLKFPATSQNSPATETTETIKLDYNSRLLRSKVVTSTPMVFFRKDVKRVVEPDFDLSEIKSNANPEKKLKVQSVVVVERVDAVKLARKPAAKSGIQKPSQLKK